MASVRFLKDLQLRILEVILRDGKMIPDIRVQAVRNGQIFKIEAYNDGPDSTIDIVFPANSPIHGTVVGTDKKLITLNPDIQPGIQIVKGCGC